MKRKEVVERLVADVRNNKRLEKLSIIVRRAHHEAGRPCHAARAIGIAIQLAYMSSNGTYGYRKLKLGDIRKQNPRTMELQKDLYVHFARIRLNTIVSNLRELRSQSQEDYVKKFFGGGDDNIQQAN